MFIFTADGCTAVIQDSEKNTLGEDYSDTHYGVVEPNISGDYRIWNSVVDAIFTGPKTLQEALFALELSEALEAAVVNQLAAFKKLTRAENGCLDPFSLPIVLGTLTDSVIKLTRRNVLIAVRVKIEMTQVATWASSRTLADFLGTYCLNDPEGGDRCCARF